MLSAFGPGCVTQALYKYRPANFWGLAELVKQDDADRSLLSDVREAIFLKFRIVKKSDQRNAALAAVQHAYHILSMFGGEPNDAI